MRFGIGLRNLAPGGPVGEAVDEVFTLPAKAEELGFDSVLW